MSGTPATFRTQLTTNLRSELLEQSIKIIEENIKTLSTNRSIMNNDEMKKTYVQLRREWIEEHSQSLTNLVKIKLECCADLEAQKANRALVMRNLLLLSDYQWSGAVKDFS